MLQTFVLSSCVMCETLQYNIRLNTIWFVYPWDPLSELGVSAYLSEAHCYSFGWFGQSSVTESLF